MRVLVVSIGTYGDVLPFIGIAAELRRRGHDVTLASAEVFRDATLRAGVPFEPLMSAETYESLFGHPNFWRPLVGARMLFSSLHQFLKPTYEFVASRNRPGDTLVVASALAVGARIAQEKLGVPVVSVHLTPIMFISRDMPPRTPFLIVPRWLPPTLRWKLQTGLYTQFIAPLLKPGLNAFRREVGLPPKRKIRSWWHSSQRMLLLFPRWFAQPQADWPRQARQFDFPRADLFGADRDGLDPDLKAFLDAGEPPVAITFGSARFGTTGLYRAAIEACVRLGRRCVVLSHQDIELPPDIASSAYLARYAPLGEVLPRCAALIHHGGVGTVALAFASATPQLIVPMAFDQFDHAARVTLAGCGVGVSRRRFTAARAAATLSHLLASAEVASSCAAAAEACRGPDAISAACDAITDEYLARASAAE